MKELFYWAEMTGRGSSEYDEDRKDYAEDLEMLMETAGFRLQFSRSKKSIYIDPTEYHCGMFVLDEEDLKKILKEMRPFYKSLNRFKILLRQFIS